MNGLSIGIGVGLKYSTSHKENKFIPPPPEPDITDALMVENEYKAIMMENDNYIKKEIVTETKENSLSTKASTYSNEIPTSKKRTTKKKQNEKNYWNF